MTDEEYQARFEAMEARIAEIEKERDVYKAEADGIKADREAVRKKQDELTELILQSGVHREPQKKLKEDIM